MTKQPSGRKVNWKWLVAWIGLIALWRVIVALELYGFCIDRTAPCPDAMDVMFANAHGFAMTGIVVLAVGGLVVLVGKTVFGRFEDWP